MELVGRADPALGTDVASVLDGADVLVDFTIPATVVENARRAAHAGVHVVIGATGWNEADLRAAISGGAGKVFVEEVLRCHGEYGKALGLMPSAAPDEAIVDRGEARNALLEAIATSAAAAYDHIDADRSRERIVSLEERLRGLGAAVPE